jgi:hypothetical protein
MGCGGDRILLMSVDTFGGQLQDSADWHLNKSHKLLPLLPKVF